MSELDSLLQDLSSTSKLSHNSAVSRGKFLKIKYNQFEIILLIWITKSVLILFQSLFIMGIDLIHDPLLEAKNDKMRKRFWKI